MYKTDIIRHRVLLPAEAARLCELRRRIYQSCAAEEIPGSDTRLMVLAVDEAISNIIEHANLSPENSEIEVQIEIGDGRISAEITDKGRPFDPRCVPAAPMARAYPRRGFGLFLIHSIVSNMEYERTDDGRNVLTLTKNIG